MPFPAPAWRRTIGGFAFHDMDTTTHRFEDTCFVERIDERWLRRRQFLCAAERDQISTDAFGQVV